MKKIKKDIKNLNNLVTAKKSNGKFKLGSWHHYNNMINKINKICSKDKDLKQSDTLISITEILSEYIRKTPKKEDSDRVKTVTELRDNLEKYMGRLKNVDELVRVSDKDFKSTILKNRYSKNAPLFPKGRPHPDDVKQGLVGDCYLMATLISVAKTDPKAIVDCFVDYPKGSNPPQEAIDKFNKLKRVRIRLFKYRSEIISGPDISELLKSDRPIEFFESCMSKNKKRIIGEDDYYKPTGQVIIDIDKSNVTLLLKKALWVSLLEKAFAVYRKRGFDVLTETELCLEKCINVPKILEGGYNYIETVITGKACKETYPEAIRKKAMGLNGGLEDFDKTKEKIEKKFSTMEYKQNKSVYTKIERLLKEKRMLIASCHKKRKGLVANHMYAVTGTKEESGYLYIQVCNPHRSYSRGYEKGKDGKMHGKKFFSKSERGSSWIELNDFCKHFKFSYTKKEKKEPEI